MSVLRQEVISQASFCEDRDLLLTLYRSMLLIRVTEETIADLLERKEIRCPTHLYTGQEAIAVGVCAALEASDLIWGGHRSHGHYLAKGGDLRTMMGELYGKVTGCSKGRGGSMHLVAPEVGILGTVPLLTATVPLAVGAALAFKLRGEPRVSVSFFGDGATEEGHFHESLNLAAIYRLPVLFVCENNFYSSHMHLLERRIQQNIYKAGDAHGVPASQLDGNEVIEVYNAAVEAVTLARNEQGPTLLECRTYRWRGHVGPAMDMDVGVRRKDELKDWKEKDPVMRAHTRLIELGIPSATLDQLEKDVQAEVHDAVEFARQSPDPCQSELSEFLFATSDEDGWPCAR